MRHHARRAGQSKYCLGRIFRVLADLIGIKMLINFAAHPIRWFLLLSLPLFFVAPALFMLGFVKVTGCAGTSFAIASVSLGIFPIVNCPGGTSSISMPDLLSRTRHGSPVAVIALRSEGLVTILLSTSFSITSHQAKSGVVRFAVTGG